MDRYALGAPSVVIEPSSLQRPGHRHGHRLDSALRPAASVFPASPTAHPSASVHPCLPLIPSPVVPTGDTHASLPWHQQHTPSALADSCTDSLPPPPQQRTRTRPAQVVFARSPPSASLALVPHSGVECTCLDIALRTGHRAAHGLRLAERALAFPACILSRFTPAEAAKNQNSPRQQEWSRRLRRSQAA